MGSDCVWTRNLRESLSDAQLALRVRPDHADKHFRLALCHALPGEFDSAKLDAKNVMKNINVTVFICFFNDIFNLYLIYLVLSIYFRAL